MGKNSDRSNKSTLAKDQLGDRDFDKLVVETSHKVIQNNLIDPSSPEPSLRVGAGLLGKIAQEARIQHESRLMNDYNRLNQPKRPMNAFMVWGQAIRRELHHRFSNVQNALLSKALGRVWRSLEPADKEPFVRKANLIKAAHKRDYPNYRYQPRRIQERRSRSNMLIGINLNHPVTQQLRQTNCNMNRNFGLETNQSAQIWRDQYHDQQAPNKHKFLDLERTNARSRAELVDDMVKQADAVQTFEYQPYPAVELVFPDPSLQPVADGGRHMSANPGCHGGYYREFSIHHSRQASCNKQAVEVNYQPYNNIAYNMHPQYHQQPPSQDMQQTDLVECNVSNNGIYYPPTIAAPDATRIYDIRARHNHTFKAQGIDAINHHFEYNSHVI